jgi:hypothetical protein
MMKRATFITATVVLLLGLLTSISCLGTTKMELIGTAVAETLTAIATTQAAQVTPTATPSPKVALVSFHGRYVTAAGASGGWLLKQESDLSPCGWFTLRYLDDGKAALMTCHDRYVTAPKTGATRADWLLWQESELGDCGHFVLHDLGRDGVAFETCAKKFFTAGDGNWDPGLEWAVVAETNVLQAWERFTVLQAYIPPPPIIADFDSCTDQGELTEAIQPSPDNSLVVSYVWEDRPGCVARLEYDIDDWSAFLIRLQDADLSPYSQLVFDVKADAQKNVPGRVKIELKRAGGREVSIWYIEGITTDWQTIIVNLSDLESTGYADPLSSFTDMEELLFTFGANESGRTGVIYLDNITLRRESGNP